MSSLLAQTEALRADLDLINQIKGGAKVVEDLKIVT